MYNAKELTNELFGIAESNGFSRTPEITAYINSLVAKVGGNLDLRDRLHVHEQVKDRFRDYLRIESIRRFAKANVLRWLNTADEILLQVSTDSNLSAKVEIAKMLQLDEMRCDERQRG
jgi:hypothetical protein